jgi:hypothetical protein
MLRKRITWNDLDGNPVSDDFYFNLTASEIAKMEIGVAGGLSEHFKTIVATEDMRQIIEAFEAILAKAFGCRSDDGKRLLKSSSRWEEFTETGAYDALFMELISDAEGSANFFKAIIPADLASRASIEPETAMAQAVETIPNWITQRRDPTDDELGAMTAEQLAEYLERSELPAKTPYVAPWIAEDRDPTKAEMRKMSRQELLEATRRRMQRNKQ